MTYSERVGFCGDKVGFPYSAIIYCFFLFLDPHVTSESMEVISYLNKHGSRSSSLSIVLLLFLFYNL